MRIVFHVVAEKETEEVADYYELQLPGLGAEFYHELGTILGLPGPNPWMGVVYSGRIAGCCCNASRLRSITNSQTTRSQSWRSRTNADCRATGKAVNRIHRRIYIVWLSDFGANATPRFDPKTEQFTVLKSTSRNASVRQILGRPGEVWLPESGADKLTVIRE